MKTFNCACGELIFFENVTCVVCGRELGFLPDVLRLSSLEPAGNGVFKANESKHGKQLYKKCQNYAKESVCNWMIPVENTARRGKGPVLRLLPAQPDDSRLEPQTKSCALVTNGKRQAPTGL